MSFFILDLATTGLDGADKYFDDEVVSAPSNYKDPQKIADYIAGKRAERADRLALDLDCCRIIAVGTAEWDSEEPRVDLCQTEDQERTVLAWLGKQLVGRQLLTYNGLKFDLPILLRRCLYLNLPVPDIRVDKYRTRDVDLWDALTFHGAVGGHSLSFYCKRLGWTDLKKPLSGGDEARVPQTGQWAELEASVRHDVAAIQRLAVWLQLRPGRDMPGGDMSPPELLF
jgi:hypothetical protein